MSANFHHRRRPSAHILNQIQTKLDNIKPLDGSVVVRHTPDGVGIRATPAGTPNLLTPVILTAKVDYNTYTGDVYGDGLDDDPTEEDATIRILEINSGESIPCPTTLPAWRQSWQTIGGSASSRTAYWTVDIARFYDD